MCSDSKKFHLANLGKPKLDFGWESLSVLKKLHFTKPIKFRGKVLYSFKSHFSFPSQFQNLPTQVLHKSEYLLRSKNLSFLSINHVTINYKICFPLKMLCHVALFLYQGSLKLGKLMIFLHKSAVFYIVI
jgi:hypothetical protein